MNQVQFLPTPNLQGIIWEETKTFYLVCEKLQYRVRFTVPSKTMTLWRVICHKIIYDAKHLRTILTSRRILARVNYGGISLFTTYMSLGSRAPAANRARHLLPRNAKTRKDGDCFSSRITSKLIFSMRVRKAGWNAVNFWDEHFEMRVLC